MKIKSVPAPEGRPDPDAILKRVKAETSTRGKLKIFLGAAPGVGKTYAMLAGAQRLKSEGVDVVIGVVETHGRIETSAMLHGLDILPRVPVVYRGRTLQEFDLDAALVRRPTLLIVDELAHSNPPDCRHPKRYQDVEELIAAGINVWTALNIQHVESLSDVVSRITGVRIRETIPDTVIENAAEVVVVDITPGELIERLKEGKVYLSENARRAIDRFFKPSNLTALRELALRRTADQVDEQMVSILRDQAIEGPWRASERLMVLVGGEADNDRVVREAARLAAALKADLFAVNIRQNAAPTDQATQSRIDESMRLADRLGAETVRLDGRDYVREVLRYAKKENITQILVGRAARLNEPSILPRGQAAFTAATREQELTRLASCQTQVLVDGLAGLVGQLKSNRPTGLLLADGGAIHRVTARCDVINANHNDITPTQLAIDCQIKESKIALLALDLELCSDRPDVAGSQWRLRADEFPFVPRHASWLHDWRGMFPFHGLSPC